MANAHRIATGFPFPLFVNETTNKQQIAAGDFVNEEISSTTRPVKMAGEWNGFAGSSGGFAG